MPTKIAILLVLLAVWRSQDSVEARNVCSNVTFVSRRDWEARSPRNSPVKLKVPVGMAFIHHSVTPNCTTRDACIRQVKSIQTSHMNSRGYNDIGYSFLIGGDGRVYVGRGWDADGAHTCGYNSVAHGFCMIGEFTRTLPSRAAILAARNLIGCGIVTGKIKRNFELFGHRDAYATASPGDALYREIQRWPNFSRRKLQKKTCNS